LQASGQFKDRKMQKAAKFAALSEMKNNFY